MNVDYSTAKWLKLRQMVEIQASLVDSLTEFEQLEPSMRAAITRTPEETKAQRVLLEAERSKLWEWQGKFDVYEAEMKRRLTIDQEAVNWAVAKLVISGGATESWARETLKLGIPEVRALVGIVTKDEETQ